MSNEIVWFEQGRIPQSRPWPFLSAARATLVEIKASLVADFDMTEGGDQLLMTGCIGAYRQAVLRRVLDLAQSTAALWNLGFLTGSLVSARALLETLAIFHSFLKRAEALAAIKDWERIRLLKDAYAFSTSAGPGAAEKMPEAPPRIGRAVREFIAATQPGQEHFWDQICDAAHPNGNRMLALAGTLGGNHYRERSPTENEPEQFPAIYNALYSCCWLAKAQEDLEILLEVICNGGPLPTDHPLIVARAETDKFVDTVMRDMGNN